MKVERRPVESLAEVAGSGNPSRTRQYVIRVAIRRLEVNQRRDRPPVLGGQVTHFLTRDRVTDKHGPLDPKRFEDCSHILAEANDIIAGLRPRRRAAYPRRVIASFRDS